MILQSWCHWFILSTFKAQKEEKEIPPSHQASKWSRKNLKPSLSNSKTIAFPLIDIVQSVFSEHQWVSDTALGTEKFRDHENASYLKDYIFTLGNILFHESPRSSPALP